MFDWQTRPDSVFTTIVTAALEHACDQLDVLGPEDLGDAYPQIGRVFTRDAAEREARRLLEAHRSEKVYRLGAYHELLLHDFLFDFTEVFNDGVLGEIVEEGTVIRRIDFDGLLMFFLDVDFQLALEDLARLGLEGRRQMGLEDQAFNIAAGLEPHPQELALEEVSPRKWAGDPVEETDEDQNFHPGSTTYPWWAEDGADMGCPPGSPGSSDR
jgi:hypothetical protein